MHALLLGNVPFGHDENVYDHIRPLCCFVTPSMRDAVNNGRADYVPALLNQASFGI